MKDNHVLETETSEINKRRNKKSKIKMMILTAISLIKINNSNHSTDLILRKNSKPKTESNKLNNNISSNYLLNKKALPLNLIKKFNKILPKIYLSKSLKIRKKFQNLSVTNLKPLLLLFCYFLSNNNNQLLKATQITVLSNLLK